MKTVRFSQVVAKSGKPEVYLTLIAPAKDRHLQSAIKAHKVMTVRQDNAGSKVDRGEVGFEEGPERQYLIFPRSLQRFAGRKVVGIKYGLIADPQISKSQLAPPLREMKRRKPKSNPPKPLARALAAALSRRDGDENDRSDADGEERGTHPKVSSVSKGKRDAKAHPKAKRGPQLDENRQASQLDQITALKKLVRKAMSELEKGKAVAAFNLLKQIADA